MGRIAVDRLDKVCPFHVADVVLDGSDVLHAHAIRDILIRDFLCETLHEKPGDVRERLDAPDLVAAKDVPEENRVIKRMGIPSRVRHAERLRKTAIVEVTVIVAAQLRAVMRCLRIRAFQELTVFEEREREQLDRDVPPRKVRGQFG